MKYFTINELTKSTTAIKRHIDNTPSKEVERSLTALVEKVLDPLREAYGKPIIVTSGYRCPKLNAIVGSTPSSQHVKGEAADIKSVQDTPEENKKLFDLIVKCELWGTASQAEIEGGDEEWENGVRQFIINNS